MGLISEETFILILKIFIFIIVSSFIFEAFHWYNHRKDTTNQSDNVIKPK
jgi:hypothetical protein